MDHRASTPRPEPERSLTWPPAFHVATYQDSIQHKADLPSFPAAPYKDNTDGLFEQDLNDNPDHYFLSPIRMYEYEDWAEDSDSDADEVEWDAGITDFALFDDDRRCAQENNRPLPSKWNGMLAQQTSALQRAVARHRADLDPSPLTAAQSTSDEEMPSLTPDISPNLRDDLDIESYHGQSVSRPSIPNYLTVTVTPPKGDHAKDDAEDEDLPLSHYTGGRQRRLPGRKLERPGLRHSRTLSGRAHTWTRPSMFTVGEDSEAEDRAEHDDNLDDGEEIRGRR